MATKALYQVSLKAFLKNKKGKVLILGANVGGSFAGFFDLPGGRIHREEFSVPLTTVLQREINEEIGNSDFTLNPFPVGFGRHLLPGKFEHLEHDVQVLYLFFEGTIRSNDIKISHEHSSVEWVDLQSIDVNKYFTSGIREGVEMYMQRTE